MILEVTAVFERLVTVFARHAVRIIRLLFDAVFRLHMDLQVVRKHAGDTWSSKCRRVKTQGQGRVTRSAAWFIPTTELAEMLGAQVSRVKSDNVSVEHLPWPVLGCLALTEAASHSLRPFNMAALMNLLVQLSLK